MVRLICAVNLTQVRVEAALFYVQGRSFYSLEEILEAKFHLLLISIIKVGWL